MSDPTTIRGLDPDLWHKLRILATTRRVSLGQLLNDIIREYLDKVKS